MAFQDGFKSFPTLATPRLVLKEVQPEDAAAYFNGLETVERSVWGFRPESIEVSKTFLTLGLKAYVAKGHIRWGIFNEDHLIGEVRLFDFIYQSKAELSYWITSSARRQGFATEAVAAVVRFGFDVLELHRIEAVVQPDNTPSIALAQRIGFQLEGVLRKARNEGGRSGVWNDALVLGMLREEFKEISQNAPANT